MCALTTAKLEDAQHFTISSVITVACRCEHGVYIWNYSSIGRVIQPLSVGVGVVCTSILLILVTPLSVCMSVCPQTPPRPLGRFA